MSCQEVNFILDTQGPEALSSADKQTVELHFASCRACRDAWAAYSEIAALRPPVTPRDLRVRVATALAARAPAETRWPRRSLLLGGVLVVGAAVAAGIALQVADRAPDVARRNDEPPPAAAPSSPAAPKAAPVAATEAAGNDVVRADGTALPNATATNRAAPALDPHSIVVFVEPDPAADARATAEFAKCHEQVLKALRAVGGLNLIAGERVSAYDAFGWPPERIARELGAGTALRLRILGHQPSCSATQFDAQTGAEQPGFMVFVESAGQPQDWQGFAASVAEGVRDVTLKDAWTVIAEAQATVLNTALSDAERARALFKLRPEPTSSLEAYDDSVVAAAAQIGTTSRDAQAREWAWMGLRGVVEPYLIAPLLHSLANDPDENVRRAAAFALAHFVDEPGVREGLARAAAEDPSERSAAPCCRPAVREAARRSLLSEQELRDLALETLMNEALSDRERLGSIVESADGRGLPVSLDDKAARAVFDMGRRSEDAGVRSDAWSSLGRAGPNAAFAQVLLADLASHPDANVRGSAAAGLAQHKGDAAVRTALEKAAAEDAAPDVRRRARMALEGVDP